MYKTEYELRMENVAAIKEQIAEQSEVARKSSIAAYHMMVETIDTHLAAGSDLQKIAGSSGLLKRANASALAESEALKKLESEYARALGHANEVYPEHFAHLSEMRKAPSAGGTRFFTGHKGGKQSPLETPAAPPAVDLNRALFESQMARKLQDEET
jgi:hypothetical protein